MFNSHIIRTDNIKSIEKLPDGRRFAIELKKGSFPKEIEKVGSWRGNRLYFKLLKKDVRSLQDGLISKEDFRAKYASQLPLVEEALAAYKTNPAKIDGTAIVATALLAVIGVWSGMLDTSEHLLAKLATGTATMLGLGLKFVFSLPIRESRFRSIVEAFDGAGIKLFEKKDGTA